MDNFGALFKSTNKQSEKHPDYWGDIEIDGKKYSLAGWKKPTKAGDTYLSLKASDFKEYVKKEKQADPAGDIPF